MKMHTDQIIFNFLWIFSASTVLSIFTYNYLHDKELKTNLITFRKIIDQVDKNSFDIKNVEIKQETSDKHKLTNYLIQEINKYNSKTTDFDLIIFFRNYYSFSEIHKIIKYLYANAILNKKINYELVEKKINSLPEIRNITNDSFEKKCEELKKIYDDNNEKIEILSHHKKLEVKLEENADNKSKNKNDDDD